MKAPYAWIGLHEANLLIDIAYDGLEVFDDSVHSRFVAACVLSMSIDCPHRLRVIQHYGPSPRDLLAVCITKTVYVALPSACFVMAVSPEECREMYLFELAKRRL